MVMRGGCLVPLGCSVVAWIAIGLIAWWLLA